MGTLGYRKEGDQLYSPAKMLAKNHAEHPKRMDHFFAPGQAKDRFTLDMPLKKRVPSRSSL